MVASTRWAFEALVNSSGMGKDLMADPCWQWVEQEKKQPSDLTEEQKAALGCKCMGVRMFQDCNFPGVRNADFYTDEARVALAQPKPVEPPQPHRLSVANILPDADADPHLHAAANLHAAGPAAGSESDAAV